VAASRKNIYFMDRALITGGAGFIGSHLAQHLLESSWDVTVVDNFDPFYSKATKLANILAEQNSSKFHFIEALTSGITSRSRPRLQAHTM